MRANSPTPSVTGGAVLSQSKHGCSTVECPTATTVGPWDELRDGEGDARPAAAEVLALVERLGVEELQARQAAAAADILTMGITFTVYSDGSRHRPGLAVRRDPPGHRGGGVGGIERGLVQRLRALNLFIDDVYNDQRVVADGVFPADLLDDSVNYRPECRGRAPASSACGPTSAAPTSCATPTARCTCSRTTCACPSGVSYVIENRAGRQAGVPRAVRPPEHRAGRRLHRRAQQAARLARARRGQRPVDRRAHAGHLQLGLLRALVPRPADGRHARRGRRPLVDDDDRVYMRTIDGLEPVDVIYRRIDDLFLDPEVFRPDSTLGVARADAGVEGRQRRPSPTPPAPASPTTRSSTPGCPTSSATTSARSR